MKINSCLISLLLISLLGVKPALAIEPMTLKELSGLCENYQKDSESSESKQCVRYIKGFIDGAIAIDPSLASDSDSKADEQKSSYTERAIKSRIGNRLKLYATPANNDFCLGKPVLMKEIVTKVKKNILKQPQSDELALFVIYRTLRQEYPCKK
ncbi:MAG: Rap1a/Tai family immunity protein [Kangiellaceae bacterium]|nr:Rap1a/Tai family immunity protein [Kangiellaceae bacterium]MCW8999670.1 Rap1a/Tai family immunity protein [Kangiellaceae bacterium]MCW9016518.1 Rap1a/Tai family immunity protein [Kangiellaceae bacterium]